MEYVFFMGKPGQFFQKICFVSKNAVNEEVSLYGIIYQREFDEDQVIGNLAISDRIISMRYVPDIGIFSLIP